MQLRSKLQSLDSRKEKNEKNNCRFFLALLLLTVLQNLIKGLILPNCQMPKLLYEFCAKIQIFSEYPDNHDN